MHRLSLEHSVADHLLLGECDDLLVTCGSSFGRISYGRVAKSPMLVAGGKFHCKKHPTGSCERSKTFKVSGMQFRDMLERGAPHCVAEEQRPQAAIECDNS